MSGDKAEQSARAKIDYSKKIIADMRVLLWVVTVVGFALAFYCIFKGYTGTLPWVSAMVGLPWAAQGTVGSFYMNMAKSDHSGADGEGITYAQAKAQGFRRNAGNRQPGRNPQEDIRK